ncbi:MAG: cobalt-zinc-cadmium efflux system outer membrane protein, partial [Flavobacteriaceae bacterium]
NELIALQKQNLEILATWKRLATSQYENGKTTLADALRVDLMVNELKTEIPLLEDKHRPLQIAFNRLLNRDDSIAIDAQLDSSVSTFSSDSIKWEEHPRILELNKRIASKKYQSEAIVKQGAPKLGIGLDSVIVGERKDMAIDGNGRDAFMPMATMSIPIFRNKYKAAITETNLQIDSYEHSITATKNELITQLENAKYEAKRQEDLKALYEIQITQITQIQRLLLSEFSNSGKDLDELLLTQMKLLDYQMKEVKAKTATNIIAHKIDYLLARDHNETLLR